MIRIKCELWRGFWEKSNKVSINKKVKLVGIEIIYNFDVFDWNNFRKIRKRVFKLKVNKL